MLDILNDYIDQPENPEKNFEMGQWYLSQEHYSPAGGYFLRAAEFGNQDDLTYDSLLNLAYCLNKLGGRSISEKSVLNSAILLNPKRPEAYYFLSKSYELTQEWQESYLTAELGLLLDEVNTASRAFPKYVGRYGLIFQKALAGYHLNKWKECRLLFRELLHNYEMDQNHFDQSLWNSRHLGSGPDNVAMSFYFKKNGDKLIHSFPGSDLIKRNYAQAFQDLLVLGLYDGQPGTYLEIGAADPYWGSNTALLEEFGWKGVGLENQQKFKDAFDKSSRRNKLILQDATQIDYRKFLKKHFGKEKVINYLQVDCEPPSVTFAILLSLPIEEYKFGVITFEHDYFVDHTSTYRDRARKYLEAAGYELLINDVGPTDWYSFEDWFVHPEVISPEKIKEYRQICYDKVHKARDLFIKFKE